MGAMIKKGRENKRDKKAKGKNNSKESESGVHVDVMSSAAVEEVEAPSWNCETCTYENHGALLECEMCGQRK